MRIVTITGKSGSGKSTIEAKLEKLGFIRLVSYTTRMPREGEVEGKDYHFRSKERFNQLFDKGYIIEKAEYAGNLYGLEQPIGGIDFVAVVETDGIKSLKNLYGNQVKSIYLNIDTDLASHRRNNRNQMTKEVNSLRNECDDEKFKDIHEYADIIIDVNNKDANEVVCEIIERLKLS